MDRRGFMAAAGGSLAATGFGHPPHARAREATGLGEREHLANPSIDLETHIQDMLGVINSSRD